MSVASPGVLPEAGTLLAGQMQVLERIARGAPLPAVLRAIVLLVERHAPGLTASVLLLDPDGVHLRHGAAPSLPPDYVAAVNGLSIGPRAGSCGTAAFHNSPVVTEDARTDPLWEDYRALASEFGIRGCWSTPINGVGNSVLGTFAVYSAEPRRPSTQELSLIGVATYLAGIAIERRRAEEELRVSFERLRLVSRATDDTVWDWDLQSGALWWGDGARALMGCEPSELEPDVRSWTTRIHPDDHDRVVTSIHAVIDSGGNSWTCEYRFRKGDGSFAAIFDRGYVIRDADARPVRMVGSMMDVTESRRAHQALTASERQLREAQRVARLGSWEWDTETGAVTWSEELYRLFGVTAAEFHLTRDAIREFVHEDDRAMTRQLADECVRDAHPIAYDVRIRRADGRQRILHSRGQPVTDATGKVVRVVGTAQDVTERRRTEARLRESQRRLRTLTAHREAILEEERARISREIHDELGEILTASKLDLAWIREAFPDAPDEIRSRLDDLAARLDATVKTVRRISTELRPIVLDQLGLSAATEWQVRDFAHRTGIACSTHADVVAPSLPRETATGLFRILQEALTNIARHARATTVRVDLRTVADTVCLEVEDDGCGIPDSADPDALGILGMRERALLLGGALEMSQLEPSGTRLSVWAPLPT